MIICYKIYTWSYVIKYIHYIIIYYIKGLGMLGLRFSINYITVDYLDNYLTNHENNSRFDNLTI